MSDTCRPTTAVVLSYIPLLVQIHELAQPRLQRCVVPLVGVGGCAAAGVLYVLLPARTAIDFPSFAATYVLGCILGIASHAPGGIGVFEATMLKFVPAPSTASLFASLLLFRIIYYLAPFVFALALLGANEGLRRWTALRKAIEAGQRSDDD